MNVECGAHRAQWVVIMGNRRPEYGHDIVANMLVDDAAETDHTRIYGFKIAIEHGVDFFGTEHAGEPGKAHDIGKQHRNLAALAGGNCGGCRGGAAVVMSLGQFCNGFEQPLAVAKL